jgi:hypothetical protein
MSSPGKLDALIEQATRIADAFEALVEASKPPILNDEKAKPAEKPITKDDHYPTNHEPLWVAFRERESGRLIREVCHVCGFEVPAPKPMRTRVRG